MSKNEYRRDVNAVAVNLIALTKYFSKFKLLCPLSGPYESPSQI